VQEKTELGDDAASTVASRLEDDGLIQKGPRGGLSLTRRGCVELSMVKDQKLKEARLLRMKASRMEKKANEL